MYQQHHTLFKRLSTRSIQKLFISLILLNHLIFLSQFFLCLITIIIELLNHSIIILLESNFEIIKDSFKPNKMTHRVPESLSQFFHRIRNNELIFCFVIFLKFLKILIRHKNNKRLQIVGIDKNISFKGSTVTFKQLKNQVI